MPGEKTERATPKKRGEAHSKGNVPKSADLNGAVVLIASLVALSAFGRGIMARLQESMTTILALTSRPEVVDRRVTAITPGERPTRLIAVAVGAVAWGVSPRSWMWPWLLWAVAALCLASGAALLRSKFEA